MVARIYRPAKTAMSSGQARAQRWVLEYEPERPKTIEPLMGYTSSDDMRSQIRLEFEVRRRRNREAWRIVLVHERRVEWRNTLRTRGSSGSFRVRRTLRDLDGPDRVTARAAGPRGMSCEAAATLPA